MKIQWFNLANILARRMVIPELMQENATPEKLSAALFPLLTSKQAREDQRVELKNIAAMLGAEDDRSPSEKAAEIILNRL